MTRPTGPACGNNPNHALTDGDRQAIADFRAYLEQRADGRGDIIRYRKKPVEVWTIQWTGDNEQAVQAFTGGASNFYALDDADRQNSDDPEATATVHDKLHSTWVLVYTGQHIVRGVKGEFYPIAEDVLAETYERVDAPVPSSGGHTDTPSRRAGLRDELRRAFCEADGRMPWGSDMLEPNEYGEQADTALAVLYREWPWLRAEAEDAPPADQAADEIRDQLLHAIDHAYTSGVLGYGTPEELLAAYDTSRTPVPPASDHTDPARAAVYAEAARTATQTAARLRAEGHTVRALGAEDVADLLHAAARQETDGDHTDRRDQYAALFRSPPGAERLGDATPGEIADAVMAVADAEQAELASLAVNAGRALQDEKRHYEIACQENAELRARVAELEARDTPTWRQRAERAEARLAVLEGQATTPTDQTTLRKAVADALRPHASLGGTPPRYELPFFDGATPSLPRISGWKPLDDVADAVLAVLATGPDTARAAASRDRIAEAALSAVEAALGDTLLPDAREEALAGIMAALPEPADRAAVLNAAALHLYTVLFPAVYNYLGQKAAEGVNRAVSELRRMADETATTETAEAYPPAAAGLPAGTLEAAEIGANRLDAWARTPHGRNFLAHALVQLARTGWLRTEPGEGFEPMRDQQPAAGARQDGATP